MALNVFDLVVTIFWSAMFIAAGVVSAIGLRTVVSFCAPRFAATVAWRNIPYARIVSLVFCALYLMYGISFSVLRGWLPEGERGWVGVFGYVLVVLHMGALNMIIDEYKRERRIAAKAADVTVRP